MVSAGRPRGWLAAVMLVAIAAVAAAYRFWNLSGIPPGFHYDEAYEALEAWRVITQPGYHPLFFLGNFGVEPMFVYLTSIAFRVLGPSPAAMRFVAAVAGTATVLALLGLGRELVRADERIPRATPWLAAAALAIMRWHIHFSRVGIEPVLVPLFLVLILWSFWRALRTGGIGAWAALGLATGLSPYTYPAGRLLPLLVLMLALAALAAGRRALPDSTAAGGLRGRSSDSPRRPLALSLLPGLILAGGLALAVAAPLGWTFLRDPEQWLLRSSQIAVGTPGEGRGSVPANILATLAMFTFRGDADPRSNLPGVPVLDPLAGIPFYLGIAGGLWWLIRPVGREGNGCRRALPLAGLFVAGATMLAPTVFSEYAPHFRRALGAAPVVAAFTGIGLGLILDGGPRLAGRYVPVATVASSARFANPAAPLAAAFLVIAVLAGSAWLSAQNYFVRWGRSNDAYYAYDEGLWEIGQYVLGLPASEVVYMSPRPAGDMTLAFAWRDGRPVRHFDGRHAFVVPAYAPAAGRDATYIIVEYEDYRGEGLLRELYPEAKEAKRFLDRNGRIYARAYHVANAAAPVRRPRFTVAEATSSRWDRPPVELAGYDLDSLSHRAGEIFYLQLWWRPTAGGTQPEWTVFTHLLGPKRADGGVVWAGQDGRPGQGSVPTSTWTAGELVLDEYQLRVPEDAPRGEYQVEIGLYDEAGTRARTSGPSGRDHLILATVRVE